MFPIRVKVCSESDLRMLGDLARNIQRVLPVTQADIDAAAALGKGWVVWKVIEVSDPLDNLRGGTQLVIKQNSVQPGQNVRRVIFVSGPGGETVVIGPGPSPLLLPDAIANSLSYVKAFGGTEQRNLPDGYTQLEYLGGTRNAYADLGTITIEPDDTIYCESILVNNGKLLFGLDSHTRCYVAQSGTGTSTFAGKSYAVPLGTWIVDGTTVNTIKLTSGKFTINGVDFTPTGTASSDICSSFGINTVINGVSGSDTSVSYIKKFYIKSGSGNYKVNLIPFRSANNVFGYYDTVSKTLLTNVGTDNFTAGPTAVPTPDAPMDIISNNGALKVSPNLFDINNMQILGRAYTVTKNGNNIVATAQAGTVTASRVDFFIPASVFKPNTTYYLRTKSNVALTGNQCNIGKATQQSSTGNAYYASLRTKENGGWSGAFTITDIDPSQEYVSFFYYLGAQTEGTVITISDIMITEGSTATTGIYADGMVETIRDAAGHTATAQMLLGINDTYRDEQNITTGAITRRVGVKVLDGTEGWASYQSGACWAASSLLKDKVSGNYKSFSTHYGWISSDPNNMQNNKFLLHGTQRLCIKDDRFETATGFIQFLADQYTAGTPVIIVYPIRTPTTEVVAGQALQVTDGDNVLEITQASISGLELEAEYEQGVEAQVEEIEP